MAEKMKVVNFKMERELIEKIKELAKKEREPMSLFVRKTLWREVERRENGG